MRRRIGFNVEARSDNVIHPEVGARDWHGASGLPGDLIAKRPDLWIAQAVNSKYGYPVSRVGNERCRLYPAIGNAKVAALKNETRQTTVVRISNVVISSPAECRG